MNVRAAFLVLTATVGASSGCLAPKQAVYDTHVIASTGHLSAGTDGLWDAVQRILRQNRFPLDRVDRRAGTISTLPVVSQNVFEFWRHDVDTREDLLEATINPIRRWAQVQMVLDAQGDWERLDVVVHKERLSSVDRQFNSTAAAYRLFGAMLPTTTGQEKASGMSERWLNIGRDEAMAAYLLQRIVSSDISGP